MMKIAAMLALVGTGASAPVAQRQWRQLEVAEKTSCAFATVTTLTGGAAVVDALAFAAAKPTRPV